MRIFILREKRYKDIAGEKNVNFGLWSLEMTWVKQPKDNLWFQTMVMGGSNEVDFRWSAQFRGSSRKMIEIQGYILKGEVCQFVKLTLKRPLLKLEAADIYKEKK